MKKMKKLAALFLAVVMIMAMGMTAMAAGSNSIVIKGALDNAKYKAYKIFDVEVTSAGDEEGYSYTRPSTAKKLGDLDGLFTVVDNGGNKVYYIPKEDLTGSELAEKLEAVAAEFALNVPVQEVTAANGTATISSLEAGYYYVVSDQGSVAMLRAVDGTEPTVITEKNTTSGWGDEGGKKAYSDEERENEEKFYAIGEKIYYEVTYTNAVNFTKESVDGKDVTRKVYQYTAKDTMPEGVTLDVDSLAVTVTDKNGGSYSENTYDANKSTVTEEGFEIVIPWAATPEVDETDEATAEDFYYKNVPAEIKITYEATVTRDVNSAGQPLTNRALISYNTNPFDENDHNGDNDVYTGTVTIQKYDSAADSFENATDDQKLADATFKIYRYQADEATREYLVQNDTTKAISWGAEDDATEFTTGDEGTIEVAGLDKGIYYLKETVAPAGYNALEDTKENEEARSFEIAAGDSTEVSNLVVSAEIANSTGTVLPSTGGIGTTIFYVIGGILVVGAAVLLITKKRMSARN